MNGLMRVCPPPSPFPHDSLANARYLATWYPRELTVDQTWALREVEQDRRNRERLKDWAVRFRVLGPRPGDVP